MSVAQLALVNGKWTLSFNGELIKESTQKYYLTSQVKNGMMADRGILSYEEVKPGRRSMSTQAIIDAGTGNATPVVSEFTVEERFDMIRDVTAAVARKQLVSAILSGEGGLGKSHTMLEGMELGGLRCARKLEEQARKEWLTAKEAQLASPAPEAEEATEEEDESESEDDGFKFIVPQDAFIQLKGYTTARGLYETLFQYNGRTIVFDDCDKALTDSTSEMILKGALDSTSDRWISWRSGRLPKGVPREFLFTGTAVFVTNMAIEDIDGALLSRSTCIDISMTIDEKITRMRQISSSEHFMPEVKKTIVRECMDLVEQLKFEVTELNMRTLIKAVLQRQSVPNWKNVFKFSACR